MLSATQQLIGTLDEFEVSQQTGESPSPAQIRELFRLRDRAKVEIAALAIEQHTELDPPPAGEDGRELTGAEAARALDAYFHQDAPAASPRTAAPSHPAEGTARVGQRPTLDEIAASLDRAIAKDSRPNKEAKYPPPGCTSRPNCAACRRAGFMFKCSACLRRRPYCQGMDGSSKCDTCAAKAPTRRRRPARPAKAAPSRQKTTRGGKRAAR